MVRIGIIGVGRIANGVHIPEIQKSNGGEIVAICDNDEAALKKTAEKLNIDKDHCFTDYKKLIACDDVDAVEICTPNYLHVEMAEAAIKSGKPVNVEKPLSISLEQVGTLGELAEKENVPNMMSFSYRFKPAVRYAKWIMEKGLIGKVLTINVEYLKASAIDKNRPMEWRFKKALAGTGVLGDLGVHLIDMARFLVGDFVSICGKTGIFVDKRPVRGTDHYEAVETDDFCNFIAELEGGTHASFSITRCAIGHKNTIKFDIFGSDGVLSFDLNNPDILYVCVGEVDLKSNSLHMVNVPGEFRITQEQTFINMASGEECKYLPTIKDGIENQKILDAILKSSEEGVCVKI